MLKEVFCAFGFKGKERAVRTGMAKGVHKYVDWGAATYIDPMEIHFCVGCWHGSNRKEKIDIVVHEASHLVHFLRAGHRKYTGDAKHGTAWKRIYRSAKKKTRRTARALLRR